jgi:hypothetical protein
MYYCDASTIRRSLSQVDDLILPPLTSLGESGIIQSLAVKAAYILFELATF